MSYIYAIHRYNYGNFNAKPDVGEIDADIAWDESTSQLWTGYKATYFEVYLNNFLCSPSSSGRKYDFDIKVKSNGTWYTLYEAEGWWLPAQGTDEDYTFTGYITDAAAQVAIGTYGIEKFRIYNGNYGGYNWDLQGRAGGDGYVEFTLEQNTTPITPPKTVTASPNSTTAGSNITVSWSGQSNGIGTSISYFDILVVNSSTYNYWWYFDVYGSTIASNKSQATIQINDTGSYNIYVYAYDQSDNEYTSGANASVTIGTSSNPGAPTSLQVNKASTIYIGKNNSPAISFGWTAPTSFGNYNNFKSYSLYKNGSAIKTGITSTSSSNVYSTTDSAETKAGSYTVRTFGTVSGTSSVDSDPAKVILISDPKEPKITSTLPSSTSSDLSLTWEKTTASTNYSVSYNIDYTVNGVTKNLKSGLTNNIYTFPITNIDAGQSFTITITAIAAATGGGISINSYTTDSITKASNISFADPWIKVTNEKGTENFPAYAYNSINLSWNPATSNDNTTFSYQIWFNINGGTHSQLATVNTTSYSIINLSDIVGEGKKIGFYLVAVDSYGQTATSNSKFITRMSAPVINGAQVNNISKDGFTYKYSYSFNVVGEQLKCIYYLGIDNYFDETAIPGEIFTQSAKDVQGSISNLTTILASGKNTSIEMRQRLYQRVITQQTAKPAGQLKIRLESKTINTCYKEIVVPFDYNFVTTANFNNGDLVIQKPTLNYYNEGETIPFRFKALQWRDAAGGTTGANIVYTVVGNNKTFANRTPSTSIFNNSDTAPRADSNLNLVYALSAEIKYSDITIKTNEVTDFITIARWTDLDEVYLSSVDKTNNLVSGKIILPEGLCSSNLGNLNKNASSYSLYYENGTAIYTDKAITELQFDNKEINFVFANSSTGDISLYATVTFVNNNTNVRQIKKITPIYLIRTAGVPVAIRKGRVGINVDSTTFNEQENTRLNSALYIAASTKASTNTPVVEILANSGPTKPKFLSFLQGGVEKSSLYFNTSDGKLHCDNLYIPVSITSINGYTSGNITLTATDVKARPDTWMPATSDIVSAGTGISISGKTISWSPTAGTGISISGKTISWSPTAGTGISISGTTISNSGIRTLTATTGDSNGQIKLTINGTSTNVSVKGLGSMAYKTDTDYLPKNDGAFTGTLTGPTLTINGTINANVLKGDSIRYGTTTPTTNLAVGQIWLKPKR